MGLPGERLTKELQAACLAGDEARVREIAATNAADYLFADGTNALFAACGLQLVSEHWPVHPRTGRPASVVFVAQPL